MIPDPDYSRIERAVSTWMRRRKARDVPGLHPQQRLALDSQLREARQELEAARVELTQQRKRSVERQAEQFSLAVDWSKWPLAAGLTSAGIIAPSDR
jgi:hypothetical protein